MNTENFNQQGSNESDFNRDTAVFEKIIDRRRSNRKFDTAVKVPFHVVESSLKRAVLSPNSSNMQLWEFYWIRTEEIKLKLHELCLGQNAAKTADQLVVFVTRQDLWKKRATWNAEKIKSTVVGEETKIQTQAIKYYTKLMPLIYSSDFLGLFSLLRSSISFFMGIRKPFVRISGKADQRVVVHKSCALAAQTFMLSIAAEGYDTCPMEGFDSLRVKKLLKLPRHAEVSMIIAVGKGTDKGIYGPRFRVPFEEVVFAR